MTPAWFAFVALAAAVVLPPAHGLVLELYRDSACSRGVYSSTHVFQDICSAFSSTEAIALMHSDLDVGVFKVFGHPHGFVPECKANRVLFTFNITTKSRCEPAIYADGGSRGGVYAYGSLRAAKGSSSDTPSEGVFHIRRFDDEGCPAAASDYDAQWTTVPGSAPSQCAKIHFPDTTFTRVSVQRASPSKVDVAVYTAPIKPPADTTYDTAQPMAVTNTCDATSRQFSYDSARVNRRSLVPTCVNATGAQSGRTVLGRSIMIVSAAQLDAHTIEARVSLWHMAGALIGPALVVVVSWCACSVCCVVAGIGSGVDSSPQRDLHDPHYHDRHRNRRTRRYKTH